EAQYDFAYLFKYSPREGTKAWRVLPDDVGETEKLRRLELLIEQQEAISLARNRALIGREVEGLVEGPARRPDGALVGRSREFKTTVFAARGVAVGDLVRVRVVSVSSHTLTAERRDRETRRAADESRPGPGRKAGVRALAG